MKDRIVIEDFQVFSTLIIGVLGMNLFSYAQAVTKYAATDGWLVTILAGAIAIGLTLVILKLIKINNYQNFNLILEANLGVFFGKVTVLIFGAYAVLYSALSLRVFGEVLKLYLLSKTPITVLLVSLITLAGIIVNDGIENVVRFNSIVFGFIFIPLGIIMMLTMNNVDFTNILPIFNGTFKNYIMGTSSALTSFTCIFILFILVPYAKHKQRINRISIKALGFVVATYIIVTLMAVILLSKDEVVTLLWPTITMIRSINIKSTFIEKWEGVVMIFWILFFYANFITIFVFVKEIIKTTFNIKKNSLLTVTLGILYYFVSRVPENVDKIYEFKNTMLFKGFGYIIMLIPMLLLLITKVRTFVIRRGK